MFVYLSALCRSDLQQSPPPLEPSSIPHRFVSVASGIAAPVLSKQEIEDRAAAAAADVHRLEMKLLEARGQLAYWKRQRRVVDMQRLVHQQGGAGIEELLAEVVNEDTETGVVVEPEKSVEQGRRSQHTVLPPAAKRPKVARCVACERIAPGSKNPGVAHTRSDPCLLPPLPSKRPVQAVSKKQVASPTESMGGSSSSESGSSD